MTEPTPDLDLSVVFATRDRADQLRDTLQRYCEWDTRGIAWELIVVDNASVDDTAQVLEAFATKLPLLSLYVAEAGQNRARNQALERLRGRFVLFTDDDVLADPDCAQAYLAATRRWPDDSIFGARIEPRFPQGTPAWMRSPDFEFSITAFARYQPANAEGHVRRHPYGPSFLVRREAIGDLRFPAHLGPQQGSYAMGGEGDFLRRLAARGHRYVYVPDARVEHVVRPEQVEPDWLLRRANKKGRGQVYLPSDKKPRRLHVFGVSVKLWLGVARAWMRFRLIAPLSTAPRQRLEQGIVYQLRRGQIQELLRLRQTAALNESAPAARDAADDEDRHTESAIPTTSQSKKR